MSPRRKDKLIGMANPRPVIYLGTTEKHAKLAPRAGLAPYQMPQDSVYFTERTDGFYLSDIYSGYFASQTAEKSQRWGLIELELDLLIKTHLLPYRSNLAKLPNVNGELFPAKSKKNNNLAIDWKHSLKCTGVLMYSSAIPASAIRRVVIYDPNSNYYITDQILQTVISPVAHQAVYQRYCMLTKWLLGGMIKFEEWLQSQQSSLLNTNERKEILYALQATNGLELFY